MSVKVTCVQPIGFRVLRGVRQVCAVLPVIDQLMKGSRKKVNMMTIDTQKVRARLEAKRTELQHEIAGLTLEEASSGQPGQGGEDEGETAQAFQEVQLDESILQNQRHLLADIEEALRRLQEGTYGRCLTCGRPIPDRRLEAIPWAVRDVECEERVRA